MSEFINKTVETELARFSARDYRGLPDAPPFSLLRAP